MRERRLQKKSGRRLQKKSGRRSQRKIAEKEKARHPEGFSPKDPLAVGLRNQTRGKKRADGQS
jgi:hypothetical protein